MFDQKKLDNSKGQAVRRHLKSVNTILYCRQWKETVVFYRDRLKLPVSFSTQWFVEFALTDGARLSIADHRRTSVKSGRGKGITLSLEVTDIEALWKNADESGLKPSDIRHHPWDARIFYVFDPEGHRLEFWQPSDSI